MENSSIIVNKQEDADEIRSKCSKLFKVPFFGTKFSWDNVFAVLLILVNAAILIVATIQYRKSQNIEEETEEEKKLRITNQSLRIVFGVFCLLRFGYELYIYKYKNIVQSMTSRIISIVLNFTLGITFIILASINLVGK
jgi:magnesium-transporting ATPase (P-type)